MNFPYVDGGPRRRKSLGGKLLQTLRHLLDFDDQPGRAINRGYAILWEGAVRFASIHRDLGQTVALARANGPQRRGFSDNGELGGQRLPLNKMASADAADLFVSRQDDPDRFVMSRGANLL